MVEVLRALAESAGELRRIGEGALPESVLTAGIGRLLERRLEQTAPAYRGVLEFLAVAGRDLDLRILEQVLPELEQRAFLLQCANTAVLEAQGTQWRFAHDKLRETLLRQIGPDERPRLHGRVAAAMESVYGAEELEGQSAVLAYHHQQAGQIEQALPYALKAGDLGMRHGLHREAREHYARAQGLLAQLPEGASELRMKADLLLKQVQAGLLTDSRDVQLPRLAAARDILDSLRTKEELIELDRLRLARIDYYYGRLHYYSGQPREAIQYYQRVLPVAQEFGDRELLVQPSAVIGMALMQQGQMRKGRALLAQAIEPMRYLAPAFDWLRVRLAHAMMMAATGDYRAAGDSLPAIHEQILATNQLSAKTLAYMMYGVIYRLGFDWPAALERLNIAINLAQQAGDKMYIYVIYGMRAAVLNFLDQHQLSRTERKLSLDIAQEMGGRMLYSDWFDAFDAESDLNTGQLEEALTRATALSAASSAAGQLMSHGIAERTLAAVLARLGRDAGIWHAHFARALEVLGMGGLALEIALTRIYWGQALRSVGEAAAAEEQFQAALKQLEASGCDYALPVARRAAAGDSGSLEVGRLQWT